jgi:hypothetical protein
LKANGKSNQVSTKADHSSAHLQGNPKIGTRIDVGWLIKENAGDR